MRMVGRLFAGVSLLVTIVASPPAGAVDASATMAQFFAIWDDDAHVTLAAVRSLYASEVVYYGRRLSREGVYADKRAFVRRWPDRRYRVLPGTVTKSCRGAGQPCRVSAVLAYRAGNAARGARASGFTRVSLDLVQQDGDLKIARESGRKVPAPE